MNRHTAYLLLIISLLIGGSTAWAQDSVRWPLDTIRGRIYHRYTVEKSVGLYRISVNFGVTQEDILRANPDLQKRGLRYGEVILIPAGEVQRRSNTVVATKPSRPRPEQQYIEPQEQPVAAAVTEEVPVTPIASSFEVIDDTADVVAAEGSAIRIAYLLPLYANALKRDKNMERFYDFYAGALLAINDIQASTGQKIEVFTYDVEKTDLKVGSALHDIRNHDVDAIIGPAYPQQVALAADFAKKDSTWLLVPFSSQVPGLQSNPYVLQFNPTEEAEADTLARYLASLGDKVHCVLMESKENETLPSGIAALHKALQTYRVPATAVPLHTILVDSLDGVLRPDAENIFIFNTEKFTNLQAVMPHLQSLVSRYQVTLFSHYSWQKERIVLPQIYTSVFAQEPNIPDNYEESYRLFFDHTLSSVHPRFDLLGYDLTHHLLRMLLSWQGDSSDNEHHAPTDDVYYGTQCNIRYEQVNPIGGYENRNIYIIRK